MDRQAQGLEILMRKFLQTQPDCYTDNMNEMLDWTFLQALAEDVVPRQMLAQLCVLLSNVKAVFTELAKFYTWLTSARKERARDTTKLLQEVSTHNMQTAWDDHEEEVEEKLATFAFMFIMMEADMASGAAEGEDGPGSPTSSQAKIKRQLTLVLANGEPSGLRPVATRSSVQVMLQLLLGGDSAAMQGVLSESQSMRAYLRDRLTVSGSSNMSELGTFIREAPLLSRQGLCRLLTGECQLEVPAQAALHALLRLTTEGVPDPLTGASPGDTETPEALVPLLLEWLKDAPACWESVAFLAGLKPCAGARVTAALDLCQGQAGNAVRELLTMKDAALLEWITDEDEAFPEWRPLVAALLPATSQLSALMFSGGLPVRKAYVYALTNMSWKARHHLSMLANSEGETLRLSLEALMEEQTDPCLQVLCFLAGRGQEDAKHLVDTMEQSQTKALEQFTKYQKSALSCKSMGSVMGSPRFLGSAGSSTGPTFEAMNFSGGNFGPLHLTLDASASLGGSVPGSIPMSPRFGNSFPLSPLGSRNLTMSPERALDARPDLVNAVKPYFITSSEVKAVMSKMEFFLSQADPDTRILMITGPAGTGKTEIVRQYIDRCRRPADVYWFNASSSATLFASLYQNAEQMGICHTMEAEALLECFLTRAVSQPETLFVFDDLRCTADLMPYVPIGIGKVLVTTRCQDVWEIPEFPAVTPPPACSVRLSNAPPPIPGWGRCKRVHLTEPLGLHDAALLWGSLADGAPDAEVAEALLGQPTALIHVSAYCRSAGAPPADALRQVLGSAGMDQASLSRQQQAAGLIAAAYRLNLQQLLTAPPADEGDPLHAAVFLLGHLAFLAPDWPVPLEALESLFEGDQARLKAALEVLAARHLVHIDTQPDVNSSPKPLTAKRAALSGSLSMRLPPTPSREPPPGSPAHWSSPRKSKAAAPFANWERITAAQIEVRLSADVLQTARELLPRDLQGNFMSHSLTAVARLMEGYRFIRRDTWEGLVPLVPHLATLMNHAEKYPQAKQTCAGALLMMGLYLSQVCQQPLQALPMFDVAHAFMVERLGPNHVDTAEVLVAQGQVLLQAGRPLEALEKLEEARPLIPKAHPQRQAVLLVWAQVQQELGRWAAATTTLRPLLDFPGASDAARAALMETYAVLGGLQREACGDPQGALALCKAALKFWEGLRGDPTHPLAVQVGHTAAKALADLRDHGQAMALLQDLAVTMSQRYPPTVSRFPREVPEQHFHWALSGTLMLLAQIQCHEARLLAPLAPPPAQVPGTPRPRKNKSIPPKETARQAAVAASGLAVAAAEDGMGQGTRLHTQMVLEEAQILLYLGMGPEAIESAHKVQDLAKRFGDGVAEARALSLLAAVWAPDPLTVVETYKAAAQVVLGLPLAPTAQATATAAPEDVVARDQRSGSLAPPPRPPGRIVQCAVACFARLVRALLLVDDAPQAAARAQQAHAFALQSVGEGHPATCQAQALRAKVQHVLGQRAEARDLYRRVEELVRAELGGDNPLVAECQISLAELAGEAKEWASAVLLLEDAVRIFEASSGCRRTLPYARTLDLLATMQVEQCALPGALASLEKSLALKEELRVEGFETFTSMWSDAGIPSQTVGKWSVGNPGLWKVEIANTYRLVGLVHEREGRHDEAIEWYQKVLDVTLEVTKSGKPMPVKAQFAAVERKVQYLKDLVVIRVANRVAPLVPDSDDDSEWSSDWR